MFYGPRVLDVVGLFDGGFDQFDFYDGSWVVIDLIIEIVGGF